MFSILAFGNNFLIYCLRNPFFRKVYNIVDDDPSPRAEVFAYARDLVENRRPGWIKQTTVQPEFFVEKARGEKRVSNVRMKKELGVRLLHPSYRSGLQGIMNFMQHYETYES